MDVFCPRFMAFDRHMNLVLGDAEEFRKLPPKKGISDDEVGSQASQSIFPLRKDEADVQQCQHVWPVCILTPFALPDA
jgi:LSM domain